MSWFGYFSWRTKKRTNSVDHVYDLRDVVHAVEAEFHVKSFIPTPGCRRNIEYLECFKYLECSTCLECFIYLECAKGMVCSNYLEYSIWLGRYRPGELSPIRALQADVEGQRVEVGADKILTQRSLQNQRKGALGADKSSTQRSVLCADKTDPVFFNSVAYLPVS